MENIVVTLFNDSNSINCDVKIPCDQAPIEFIDNLVETVNQYYGRQIINSSQIALVSRRTNKPLKGDVTIKDSGVINGDYIELVER